jgi:hypothetical protein
MFASYIILAFACCFGFNSASSSIRMPRGTFRMPAHYTLVEENRAFDGFVTIDIDDTALHITPSWNSESLPNLNFIHASSIVIGDGAFRKEFERPIRVYEQSLSIDRNPVLDIPGVLSVLLTPFSDSEDLLVSNPPTPSDYAYQGIIFYSPLVRNMVERNNRAVRLAIELGLPTNTFGDSQRRELLADNAFIPCDVFTTEARLFEIPQRLHFPFVSGLDQMGILTRADPTNPSIEFVHLPHHGSLSALPSLNVLIQTEDQTQVQIAKIDPQDYMDPTDDPNVYRVFFDDQSRFPITPRIAKNLLLHFDYANNRIGFADPLVEL